MAGIFNDDPILLLLRGVLSSWFQLHVYPNMLDFIADRDAEPGFSVVRITPEQTFIRRHRFAVPGMQ